MGSRPVSGTGMQSSAGNTAQRSSPVKGEGVVEGEVVSGPERASSSRAMPRSSLAASILAGPEAADYAVHDVEEEADDGLAVVGAFVDDAGYAGVVLQGRRG